MLTLNQYLLNLNPYPVLIIFFLLTDQRQALSGTDIMLYCVLQIAINPGVRTGNTRTLETKLEVKSTPEKLEKKRQEILQKYSAF